MLAHENNPERLTDSKIISIARYGEAGAGSKGSVMNVKALIEGREFVALNGGSQLTFAPAISFCVNCEAQQEVGEFLEKLSEGGEKQCRGRLRDKYGVSWQIVPNVLGKLFGGKDPAKPGRVMKALLQMKKFEIGRASCRERV